jgi:Tfp pilus assembly protein FimT
MTLPEALVVLAISALLTLAVATITTAWIGRERVRSTVYLMQTHIGVTRMEAVKRNRPCRFILDTANRQLTLVDLNDPGTTGDDVELRTVSLHPDIEFSNPEGGAAVTLHNVSGAIYDIIFNPDGTVDTTNSAAGAVMLEAGERFDRVTVFVAGGIQVHRWDGSAWRLGG